MGRSVSHPSGAIVAFKEITMQADIDACNEGLMESEEEDDSAPDYFDFDELIEDYQGWIKELFPSFEPCDKWLDREDHAIAENRFAYFGISEYCGLVALWLVKKDLDAGYYEDSLLTPLADRWLAQVEGKFLSTFGELKKLGNMSNGEGVYQRID
jgi:hypothetical protein